LEWGSYLVVIGVGRAVRRQRIPVVQLIVILHFPADRQKQKIGALINEKNIEADAARKVTWLVMTQPSSPRGSTNKRKTNKTKVNDDEEADNPIRLLRPDWRKRGEIL
jgi:hypothetical protein